MAKRLPCATIHVPLTILHVGGMEICCTPWGDWLQALSAAAKDHTAWGREIHDVARPLPTLNSWDEYFNSLVVHPASRKPPAQRAAEDAISEAEWLIDRIFERLSPVKDAWLITWLTKIREALADRGAR